MRTAFLIAAHHQPEHLARLVARLAHPEAVFFVHIDAKNDAAPFRQAVGERADLVFLEDRIRVARAGFSQVEATLALLSQAWEATPTVGRFCLLSGSDFPIKSNARIAAEFATAKEFVSVERRIDPGSSHYKNVGRRWFMDAAPPIRKLLSGWLAQTPPPGMTFHHGSAWWALTRDCVGYVRRFVQDNPGYRAFCAATLSPDEIFFHTILKQSPFAPNIVHDLDRPRGNEMGAHYIDWTARDGSHPKTLELEDLERLRSSPALFARKFDARISAPLIAALEAMLDGASPQAGT